MSLDVVTPAPALPVEAQGLCNLAVRLGLYPLVQDAVHGEYGVLVEVALLPGFDARPDPDGWTLAVDPGGQMPLTLLGPVLDEASCSGEWIGVDRVREGLRRHAAVRCCDLEITEVTS